MLQELIIPGQRLGSTEKFIPGRGTYVRNGIIISSLQGKKEIERSGESLPVISVLSLKERAIIPQILGKVTKISQKHATVSILLVENIPCQENFQGIIRIQDIRATEIDKVQVLDSFRPGDIIRAQIISIGDQRNYYLSTAKNEYGVLFAQSEFGNTMIPISWKQMQDPKTSIVENRKCAKPF
ncbi:hypothetical protein BB560_005119 [Smittium megazygosporum]|uniref:S1 motif domain-containing protein n=1 Tax=Smittium megazygosporum TaxID=133381 RepID=A0A2T9Z7C1_9FUNG|nr:hypothetical protein BB560_005119 [Smittium megazygosporum]